MKAKQIATQILSTLKVTMFSANDTPFAHNAAPASLLSLPEYIPEPQRFVTSAGNDDGAIRTHAQVQYTVCMAGETHNLLHRWILPNVDSMLTIPVRANELGREM